MSKTKDGHIFVVRCAEDQCDGSHAIVKIGFAGKPPIARYVTDAFGARKVAAMLCAIADEIEAHGHGSKPS